jgi:hypothetical protein
LLNYPQPDLIRLQKPARVVLSAKLDGRALSDPDGKRGVAKAG